MSDSPATPVCPPDTQISRPASIRSQIGGTLVHASHGLPLAGVAVAASLWNQQPHPGPPFGQGGSDSHGDFTITVPAEQTVGQILGELRQPHVSIVLSIGRNAANTPLLVTPALTLTRGWLDRILPVPLPTAPALPWQDFGTRLVKSHVKQFNEIVRLLLSAGALFHDWSLEQRYGFIGALETALLDPTGHLRSLSPVPPLAQLHRQGALLAYCERLGKRDPAISAAFADLRGIVETFADLLAVDWILEPANLANGEVDAVLLRARERYRAALLNRAGGQ